MYCFTPLGSDYISLKHLEVHHPSLPKHSIIDLFKTKTFSSGCGWLLMPVILSLAGQSRRIMNSRPSVPALSRQKQTSNSKFEIYRVSFTAARTTQRTLLSKQVKMKQTAAAKQKSQERSCHIQHAPGINLTGTVREWRKDKHINWVGRLGSRMPELKPLRSSVCLFFTDEQEGWVTANQ